MGKGPEVCFVRLHKTLSLSQERSRKSRQRMRKRRFFFEGGSEQELKKMPADPEQEMWEGDGGGFKSVFF